MRAILAVCFFVICQSAYAGSPEAFLRKASLRTRGVPPTAQEWKELRQAKSKQEKADEIAARYLETPLFRHKMTERVYNLLRIRENNEIAESTGVVGSIVRYVLNTNRTWDSIYSLKFVPVMLRQYQDLETKNTKDEIERRERVREREYALVESFNRIVENYYSLINKKRVEHGFVLAPESQAEKDSIAGIFTTPEFAIRYRTTVLNKNRTRAAVLFRTLFCDDMKQVAEVSNEANRSFLMFSLGEAGSAAPAKTVSDAHGSNASCQSCHYKIDPAGKTLMGSSTTLSPIGSPGMLTYKTDDGELFSQSVRGLGHLTEVAAERPEYQKCQVRHFWNWFIGEDIPLTHQTEAALVAAFNSPAIAKRPKPFIKHLMNLKVFREAPRTLSDDIRFASVKPIFKRCQSCHTKEPDAPTLDAYPFGFDPEFNADIVQDIINETNLLGNRSKVSMPPENAGWVLSESEKTVLKEWIAGGAKDDDGKVQLSRTLIAKPKSPVKPIEFVPTFTDTYSRYMTLHDLTIFIKILAGKEKVEFCEPKRSKKEFDETEVNTEVDMGFPLGKLIPDTGKMSVMYPTPEIFDSIQCLIDGNRKSLTPFYNRFIKNIGPAWIGLNQTYRLAIATALYEYLVGVDAHTPARRQKTINMALKSVENVWLSNTALHRLTMFYFQSPDFLIH